MLVLPILLVHILLALLITAPLLLVFHDDSVIVLIGFLSVEVLDVTDDIADVQECLVGDSLAE